MKQQIDVVITRINNKEYSFERSTKAGCHAVAKALTFHDPNPYAYTQEIQKFNKNKLTFPIGMLYTLINYCKENNIGCEVEDYQYDFPEGITIDDRLFGKYVHQSEAVKAFMARRFGIIVVPTRGGKTFIASELIRIFLKTERGNVLFLVDNTTLFTQAVGDIQQFFKRYNGIKVGEIKAGSIDLTQRVTVGMIQTIQSTLSDRCRDRVKKKELENYLKSLQMLIVDEVHDNCSDSKLRLYKKCKNLDYQLSLSATPYRSGAFTQNLKLQAWSGDVCYTITEDELRERGVLSDYKVFMLLVDHNSIDYNIEVETYADYVKTCIIYNDFRNKLLLDIIAILRRLNLKTLVLFSSVEHGREVAKIAGERFISGETKTKERERVKSEFLDGEGKFLFASNIFKKGVTLPEVEVIINADGGLESANTIQKKGRVLGATSSKERSLVIDFLDLCDMYFSEHSEARLDTYVDSIGEKRVGILDTSAKDCLKVLERWIEKWFRKC